MFVSRSLDKVNYSTLHGKRIETVKQTGNEIRQKYRTKFGRIERKEKNNSRTKFEQTRQQKQNENEMMKKNVESGWKMMAPQKRHNCTNAKI